MTHLLVLGGGWVGAAVASAGRRRGEVTVVDPPFDPVLASRDVAATDALRRLVLEGSVGAVVNACGRIRGSDDELADANEHFPRWLVSSLAGTGVRLVHVGSASEYGEPSSDAPVDEEAAPRPVGSYAVTKAAGTEVVMHAGDLDTVVARVFNIVGHPVPAVSPIHDWLGALAALPPSGGEVEVWWPPTTRDFVTIDDVATALVDLAFSPGAPPLVNVCSGVGLGFGDIVRALASELSLSVTVRSADRPGIESVVGDPTLLRSTLGWVPAMSLVRLARVVTGADPGGAAPPNR